MATGHIYDYLLCLKCCYDAQNKYNSNVPVSITSKKEKLDSCSVVVIECSVLRSQKTSIKSGLTDLGKVSQMVSEKWVSIRQIWN